MEIKKEIERIAEYQNAILPQHDRKSKAAIQSIINTAIYSYENSLYDFTKYSQLAIKQHGSKRKVKMYEPFSPEEILCVYLKRLLDRRFHIAYPNRNSYMRMLFDTTNLLKDMSDYTIFKFDFKDFFNSVSSVYVYRKFIKGKLERHQETMLEKFATDTVYTYAGLNTSNILCEIAAKHFDDVVMQKFTEHGMIFYRRYIDDGIVIFNRFVSNNLCIQLVSQAIDTAFFDLTYNDAAKCKTKLNMGKVKYIARRNMVAGGASQSFDFLGYEFVLSLKPGKKATTDFQYGITQAKLDKYTNRIEKIVLDFYASPSQNLELLRHQIKAFTHREVYRINRYKSSIWKNKGFISNYCELRFRLDKLTPATKSFLENSVIEAFTNNGLPVPYFLKGNKDESVYSLYNNMKHYRTLLFVEMIGIDLDALKKMCRQIGITVNPNKGYDDLVRDYLIGVKVGH